MEKIKLDANRVKTGFQCHICSRFFSTNSVLNSHIDAVHNGIRYKCTGCGKLRQRIENCREHLKKCKLSNINSKIERIELDVFK